MPYPEFMVAPMRKELTDLGFEELRTPEQVQEFVNRQDDLALVVVNSVCGCAAANARPGIRKALEHASAPKARVTVFAGMETDAVDEMRTHFCHNLHPPPALLCLREVNWSNSSSGVALRGTAPMRLRIGSRPCLPSSLPAINALGSRISR